MSVKVDDEKNEKSTAMLQDLKVSSLSTKTTPPDHTQRKRDPGGEDEDAEVKELRQKLKKLDLESRLRRERETALERRILDLSEAELVKELHSMEYQLAQEVLKSGELNATITGLRTQVVTSEEVVLEHITKLEEAQVEREVSSLPYSFR